MRNEWIAIAGLAAALAAAPPAQTEGYLEDFTSLTQCDTLATTAWWHTAAGQLELHPFNAAQVGSVSVAGSAIGLAVSGDHVFAVSAAGGGFFSIDGANPSSPAVVGSAATGDWSARVDVDGNYAYVATTFSGPGFSVVDITDPTNPSVVGSYATPGDPSGVAVDGNYAYVADDGGDLQVLDISTPTTPTFAGSAALPGNALSVAVDGNWAFLGTSVPSLQAVDVSDPTNPSPSGSIPLPATAWNVTIEGDRVFVGVLGSGVWIVDIRDPANPVLADSVDTPGTAYHVAVAGRYAYVADDAAGVQVIDLSGAGGPVIVDNVDTQKAVYVALAGEHAWVADDFGGVRAIGISQPPDDPLLVASMAGMEPAGGRIRGDYAYVADQAGFLQIVDVSDPENPTVAASLPTLGHAVDVDVVGNWAYVADALAGLTVVDVSDPTNPSIADSLEIPIGLVEVEVAGNWLYICGEGGLGAVDVTDPTNVLPGGGFDPGVVGDVNGIAVSGDHLFAVGTLPYLYVLDVSDPGAFELAVVGSLAVDEATDVAVEGDWAYVTHTSPPGFSTVDIRDLTDPVHEATVSVPDMCFRVDVEGDRAYVGAAGAGFLIFDISDPTDPVLVSSDGSLTFTIGARVSGDHAIVFDETGLLIYEVLQRSVNLADNVGQSLPAPLPAEPPGRVEITDVRLLATQTGTIDWEISATDGLHWQPILPDGSWHTVTHPGLALVWRSTHRYAQAGVNPTATEVFLEWNDVGLDAGGLAVVPRTFALHGAAPNPFRGGTHVTFDLPAAAATRLAIYDVTGRLVRTLLREELPPGRHRRVWTGRDDAGKPVGAGVYFVRLEAGKDRATGRVLALR